MLWSPDKVSGNPGRLRAPSGLLGHASSSPIFAKVANTGRRISVLACGRAAGSPPRSEGTGPRVIARALEVVSHSVTTMAPLRAHGWAESLAGGARRRGGGMVTSPGVVVQRWRSFALHDIIFPPRSIMASAVIEFGARTRRRPRCPIRFRRQTSRQQWCTARVIFLSDDHACRQAPLAGAGLSFDEVAPPCRTANNSKGGRRGYGSKRFRATIKKVLKSESPCPCRPAAGAIPEPVAPTSGGADRPGYGGATARPSSAS